MQPLKNLHHNPLDNPDRTCPKINTASKRGSKPASKRASKREEQSKPAEQAGGTSGQSKRTEQVGKASGQSKRAERTGRANGQSKQAEQTGRKRPACIPNNKKKCDWIEVRKQTQRANEKTKARGRSKQADQAGRASRQSKSAPERTGKSTVSKTLHHSHVILNCTRRRHTQSDPAKIILSKSQNICVE